MMRERQRRERRAVADGELLIDVMQMHLDGAVGDIELAPNLFVRQSFGDQMHNLTLALGQHRQYVFSDDAAGGRERQQSSAGCNLPQAMQEDTWRRLFEHHTVRASRDRD